MKAKEHSIVVLLYIEVPKISRELIRTNMGGRPSIPSVAAPRMRCEERRAAPGFEGGDHLPLQATPIGVPHIIGTFALPDHFDNIFENHYKSPVHTII